MGVFVVVVVSLFPHIYIDCAACTTSHFIPSFPNK